MLKKIYKYVFITICVLTIVIAPTTTIVNALSNPLGAVFNTLTTSFGFDLNEEMLEDGHKSTGGRIAQIMFSNLPELKEELYELSDDREIVNKVAITITYFGMSDYTFDQLKTMTEIFSNSSSDEAAFQKIKQLDFTKTAAKKPSKTIVLECYKTATKILVGDTSNLDGLTIRMNNPRFDTSNPFFFSTTNIFYDAGFVGQCTWYSHGRIMEMADELNYDLDKNALNTMSGNGADWFEQASQKQDTFELSEDVAQPRAGAVICWGGGYYDDYPCGHVAVIEKVNDDGTIAISEGWYSSEEGIQFVYMDNITLDSIENRPSSYPGHPYYFQGYIYCIAP